MAFHILRVYFKAAVLVPFYLACFIGFFIVGGIWIHGDYSWQLVAENSFCQALLKNVFFSGLTGMLTLSAFLNCYRKVAYSLFFSLLAWMLLPYSFIAFLLIHEVNWAAMSPPQAGMFEGVYLLVLCFFHVIGIIISYQDFRATVVLNIAEERERLSAQQKENTLSL
ncbi:hypothetical protein [Flavisolibacter nicotianae]|uniref:hypothetical protein n=1 Tax=Flavisolibacter nicotianae TaxID=2364882 RepID=UPI000EB4018F|nr:hypothetical protein [Flavisolibacter nicotianae]